MHTEFGSSVAMEERVWLCLELFIKDRQDKVGTRRRLGKEVLAAIEVISSAVRFVRSLTNHMTCISLARVVVRSLPDAWISACMSAMIRR
jgi:hypothetical protein